MPQFLRRPLKVSWRDLAADCIPRFFAGLQSLLGYLVFVGVPHVAIVGFDAFARQAIVVVANEGVQEDLDFQPSTGFLSS